MGRFINVMVYVICIMELTDYTLHMAGRNICSKDGAVHIICPQYVLQVL